MALLNIQDCFFVSPSEVCQIFPPSNIFEIFSPHPPLVVWLECVTEHDFYSQLLARNVVLWHNGVNGSLGRCNRHHDKALMNYYCNSWNDMWNMSYIELQVWSQISYDPRSYGRKFCDCLCRSLKNSGVQRGLNPWPRDTGAALWAMKPLTLGAGHLWVLIIMSPWRMDVKWYMKIFHILNCRFEIKWAMITAVT